MLASRPGGCLFIAECKSTLCLAGFVTRRRAMDNIFMIETRVDRTAISQSVQRLPMGRAFRGSSPGGGKNFRTRSDRSWALIQPPVQRVPGLFPRGKSAGPWR